LFLLPTGHAPSVEMPLLSYLRLMHQALLSDRLATVVGQSPTVDLILPAEWRVDGVHARKAAR
jgi:hypothetical protein